MRTCRRLQRAQRGRHQEGALSKLACLTAGALFSPTLSSRSSRSRSSRSRSSLARKAATNLEDWRAERVVQSALTRIAEFGLQLDMKSSITNEQSSSSGDWNRGGSRQSKIDDVTPKPAQARLATLWLRAARQVRISFSMRYYD